MLEHIHHPSELVQVDSQLQAAILEALWKCDPIRQSQPRLDVEVRDGVVELRGNIRSRTMKETAAELARRIPGVREVINHLVSDTDLEILVAAALAHDPRTRLTTGQVFVKAYLGTVHLHGRVASEEIKVAAEELAAQVPGVWAVVNELVAPPKPKPAPAKPVARPTVPVRPAEPTPAAPVMAPEVAAVEAAPRPAPVIAAPGAPAPEVVPAGLAEAVKATATASASGVRRDTAGRPISPHGKSAPPLSEERRKLVLAMRGG